MSRALHRLAAESIADAYRIMAISARYRPAAPSDGMGNITAPEAELELGIEASEYASTWWESENEMSYFIGCPSHEDRIALILSVEAARNICGGNLEVARRLLQLAQARCEVAS